MAGQATYSLPANFLSAVKVLVADDVDDELEMPFINFEDIGKIFGRGWINDDSGKPKVYYFSDRDVFGLHPKPDSDHSGKTIRIFYIPVPTDLVADIDIPDLEEVFHDGAKYFVAAQAHASVQNMALHDRLMVEYEKRIQRFKSDGVAGSEDQGDWQWDGMTEQSTRTHNRDNL